MRKPQPAKSIARSPTMALAHRAVVATSQSLRQHALVWGFAALLILQAAWSTHLANDSALESSPGPAPGVWALRLASLDEPALAGYATNLYLQGFDAQAGALLSLRLADAAAICDWLERAYEINPHSGYALMLAAFDYAKPAHVHDEAAKADPAVRGEPAAAPRLLDLVERAFLEDPARHWRWLAHASYVARYGLHDDERALRYARRLQQAPLAAAIPRWARELDSFVLNRPDAGQAQSALLGGLAFGTQGIEAKEIDRLAARLANPGAASASGAGAQLNK